MVALNTLVLAAFAASTASAHYHMTFPWWRGDSMDTQWTYPCGGVNQTAETDKNRTLWPLDGGAVAFEPSHPWAQTYINLGLGEAPARLNITLVAPFNQTLNGTFCLPKVTLPADVQVKEGDKATIQVIQLSTSGGALYNCADITFSEKAVAPGPEVCFNDTTGAVPLDYDGAEVTVTASGDAAPAATSAGSGAEMVSVQGSMFGVLVAAAAVAAFMV